MDVAFLIAAGVIAVGGLVLEGFVHSRRLREIRRRQFEPMDDLIDSVCERVGKTRDQLGIQQRPERY